MKNAPIKVLSWLLLGAWLAIAAPAQVPSQLRFQRLGAEIGLSHTTVWDVHQDERGFVWIATEAYLHRYDGYRLKDYRHDPEDPNSLSASEIMRIHEDRAGNLWFVTRSLGLNRYDRQHDRFIRYLADSTSLGNLAGNFPNALIDDPQGSLWLGTEAGLLSLDPANGKAETFRHDPKNPHSLGGDSVLALLVDRGGTLWIAHEEGLDRRRNDDPGFVRVPLSTGSPASPSETIQALFEDAEGSIWIGTTAGALYRYAPDQGRPSRHELLKGSSIFDIVSDASGGLWLATDSGLGHFVPETESFQLFRHDPDAPESLSSNNLFELHLDSAGSLWVATRNGISRLDPRRRAFTVLRHRPGRREGLAGHNVTSLAEDRAGALWIGDQEGGLVAWNRAESSFRHFTLEVSSIYALLEDKSGRLWAGGRGGLWSLAPGERAFRDLEPFEGMIIRGLVEDGTDAFWISTFGEGLLHYEAETETLEHFPTDPNGAMGPPDSGIYALLNDRDGGLWIGTERGLSRHDPATGRFVTWRHDPREPGSLGHDHIVDFHQDENGVLWIATYGGGLDRMDLETGRFRHYREQDGLSSDYTVGLLAVDDGGLWVSTNQGLSRFDRENESFHNYDSTDGLGSDIFLIGSRLKTAGGELLFGGQGGLTLFAPQDLEDDPVAPRLEITELRLAGEPVSPGVAGSPLQRAIGETRELTLTHRQASFSLEFAALHFANPGKNRYSFRLEGYDEQWIETDAAHRRARYTNLDPGSYVFRVRASNKDGAWTENGAALSIRVLPPPWRTGWAYGLYAILLFAAGIGYSRWQARRLAHEQAMNARLREVDRLKDEFLANTSHELRTPLFGITGLAESLLDGARGDLPEQARADLSMIVSSGRRLSGLVNDILDFSKLRHHGLELALRGVDLRALTEVVLTLMRPLTREKPVELKNAVPADLPSAHADENRLQQILLNLVGNAVKFTEEGTIEVVASLEGDSLRLSVEDTGIGIEAEHLRHIFEAFQQADATTERHYGGTGLGLAVSRELVQLHGSELRAESTPGQGSSFSFDLPIAHGDGLKATTPTTNLEEATLAWGAPAVVTLGKTSDAAENGAGHGNGDGPCILIADDEPVIRQVLTNHLAPLGGRLLQASGGPEALEMLAHGAAPDLVLLDVMMPRMSGFDVCREIRQESSLNDLPVIYLTAKAQSADLLQGFETGANDYITKPISRDELLARVRTHLDLLHMHRNLEGLVDERTAQVKTLAGLLPICSSCKKIRDDDGYWNELEEYLDLHSDIRFSHGMCLECARRLYPELELGGKAY